MKLELNHQNVYIGAHNRFIVSYVKKLFKLGRNTNLMYATMVFRKMALSHIK